MSDYPKLTTKRLTLGKIQISDIPKIVEYAGDKRVAEPTLNIPHPYQEKDAIWWINMANQGFENKSQFTFGVRLKSTNEFIGGIGIKIIPDLDMASLGYWIAVPFWNKGYASEAAAAILNFGFNELALNKIYAVHLIENPASGKVMAKNGMIKEGELKDHNKKDGKYRSIIQYRLTKSEYVQL